VKHKAPGFKCCPDCTYYSMDLKGFIEACLSGDDADTTAYCFREYRIPAEAPVDSPLTNEEVMAAWCGDPCPYFREDKW